MSTRKKKIILAYSGGLDTSVIARWLAEKDFEVICFVANIGQKESFSQLKKKALFSGASQFILSDLREELIKNYAFLAIQFNAKYEGKYLLGTALARPLIAKAMVAIAKKEKTNILSHGATGKGNDQVRFELSAYALDAKIKIIAPWREEDFFSIIKGREDAIEYAKKYKIPIKATPKKPWSSDENLLHISYEAGVLEDPNAQAPEEVYEWTRSPKKAPDKSETIQLSFNKGIPFAINQKKLTPIQLFENLNKIGSLHGIGRIDIVESRFIGMKSRGVYEAPAVTILQEAHEDLEKLCVDRDVLILKESLMPRFARLVYNGLWYTQEMNCLLALLEKTQTNVTGSVTLELYKGNVLIQKRSSSTSLYNKKIASMDWDGGAYDQKQASGFISLLSIPLKAQAKRK